MDFKKPINMPRGTHYGSNFFIVYSQKIKRNVKLYSNLEYYNFLNLEVDPNVSYFCEQPHKIDVVIDDKLSHAIFDMYVRYKDGTKELQEVKYEAELTNDDDSARRSQEQIRREQRWCEDNHYQFKVRTEKDIDKGKFWLQNLNVIAARRRQYTPTDNGFYKQQLQLVLKKKTLTIEHLCDNRLLPIDYEMDHISYLYCQGFIDMDVANRPFDKRMEVRLCQNT